MASTKIKALSAVVAASFFLGSCGMPGGDGGGEDGLEPGDYTIASAEGVRDSVVVNGKIAPIRAVSITSAVQSEVERIEVRCTATAGRLRPRRQVRLRRPCRCPCPCPRRLLGSRCPGTRSKCL